MVCKRCGQQVSLFNQFTTMQHVHFLLQVWLRAWAIVTNTSLFFLESSSIRLVWKSLPVHSFASVGKSKTPANRSNTISYLELMWWFFSGSTRVFRSMSPAFHFLRNYQRSGVWQLHKGITCMTELHSNRKILFELCTGCQFIPEI